MGRLKPDERSLASKMRRQGIPIKFIMAAFSCSRQTIWYWAKQDLRTRFDIDKNGKCKITIEVESTILFMRNSFKWGTARIQNGLIELPEFMKQEIEVTIGFCIQNLALSRQSINEVLKKVGINGYFNKRKKAWKFFRAKYPNELWQLDLKRFKLNGEKYELLVVIDDYSRNIIKLHVFDHSPNISEITRVVKPLIDEFHPKSILTDNNPFADTWGYWCFQEGVNALFAHPYYPQDKGKVERAIRNISEELVYLFLNFGKWFNAKCIESWRQWFNNKRYHRGVKDYPSRLFVKL
jgi:hypothetical protein